MRMCSCIYKTGCLLIVFHALLLLTSIRNAIAFTSESANSAAALLRPEAIFGGQCAPWGLKVVAPRRQRFVGIGATAESVDESAITIASIEEKVKDLKKVLEREYVSFFNPMEREYYSPDVTFDDPLTSLVGVNSYQQNVDMLGSRNIFGTLLFEDAGILLHSVTGGEVQENTNGGNPSISEIITRWTLRFTFKALPWKPTARFSGISVYRAEVGGPKGVLITNQTDYWDSINLQKGGEYSTVSKGEAFLDMVNELKPSGLTAVAAGPELPYRLLRRGKGYEVRSYPSFSAVRIPYQRRDDGFSTLGAFCAGLSPLAPAIMEVPVSDTSSKTMMWPLDFDQSGKNDAEILSEPPAAAVSRSGESTWQASGCEIVRKPVSIVAVATFSDASVEAIVRRTDAELREACQRDGLELQDSSTSDGCGLVFCQYDAVFSMGRRRGEVWIPLKDGKNPWSTSNGA